MDYLFRYLASKFVKQDAPAVEAAASAPATEEIQRVAEVVAAAQKVEVVEERRATPRNGHANGHKNGNGSTSTHRQRQLQLHRPHRRADLPRMRIDHDPQRQLPQVRQLRHDQRLLVV